ncbi:hypothetical protein [Actinomadura harenae]|uniref:Uncharacterized protein n=1 Tax=Actinomadura harenae TaxID=2483351 RepID=A0A3M2MBZ3_9ACTN|nr:hypothetical protein [Actinomadura harenae]RMI44718.1 hypothetical protein EBO15_12255 [Actinomadura harenae]
MMTVEIYRRTDRTGYVACATNGARLAEIRPKGDGWWDCRTTDGSERREMWEPNESDAEAAAVQLVAVRFLSRTR